jgi:riboflavin kinase/FMN adenylyltransferase
VARIRSQVKFGSVEDLIEQMGRDTDRARAILAAQD